MKHMHRPDPKCPPEMQDKRMVVILPEGLYAAWLDAPAANSNEFIVQILADRLTATSEPRPLKKGETPPLIRPVSSVGKAVWVYSVLLG
jgi:hypothetical protein